MKNGKTLILYTTPFWFLDGVMEEFIQRAKGPYEVLKMPFVVLQQTRARVGAGCTWMAHLSPRERVLPFEGLLAQFETRKIFSQIKDRKSERASMRFG